MYVALKKLSFRAWKMELLDKVVCAFCVACMVLALGIMILQGPFSFFLWFPLKEGVLAIHSLTVFLMSLTFLFFWRKILRDRPFFPRILLTIAFTMIGYTIYDSFWGLVFWCNLGSFELNFPGYGILVLTPTDADFSSAFTSYELWIGIPSAILIFLRVWKSKYIPKMPVKRVVLVLLLNFLVILWLWSTGFFHSYLLYVILSQYEGGALSYVAPDPHGVVWLIGKVLGMLSWLLVFIDFRRGKRFSPSPVRKVKRNRRGFYS